jgi:hypothetical protein
MQSAAALQLGRFRYPNHERLMARLGGSERLAG